MRRIVFAPVLILSLAAAAACTTTRSDGSPQIQTSDQAKTETVQGAVSAPLRDLNVLQTKIPAVLREATEDPYKRPDRLPRMNKAAQCAQLVQLIQPLDDALGADLDRPSRDEDDLLQKGRGSALGAVASVASDAIPFRGWVRQLTGAERHDKLVQAAITAGAVRRAYLKGLGEARGCDPPATPSHEVTQITAIEKQQDPRPQPPPQPDEPGRLKPRYPTR